MIGEIYAQNKTCLLPSNQSSMHLGLERYSMESWLLAHPQVKPCDVFLYKFQHWLHKTFEWVPQLFVGVSKKNQVAGTWYRKYGRLYELYKMYGSIPPIGSFFWGYFREADENATQLLLSQGCSEREAIELASIGKLAITV
jgi:hypothetical protein